MNYKIFEEIDEEMENEESEISYSIWNPVGNQMKRKEVHQKKKLLKRKNFTTKSLKLLIKIFDTNFINELSI
jgi:hypothetical protein